MSAFEAVGYAKLTGLSEGTWRGPAAIHLLNRLYDAKAEHVLVAAIAGQANRSATGGSCQEEVDLLSLARRTNESTRTTE